MSLFQHDKQFQQNDVCQFYPKSFTSNSQTKLIIITIIQIRLIKVVIRFLTNGPFGSKSLCDLKLFAGLSEKKKQPGINNKSMHKICA